ncbi:hypothetical protein [Paraburkholderia haematera]|uniref:Uncharacterized protein n=1 Tax=Paraburkholderia haematera TaxID=2793077 RepID=A0ABM8QT16_9BURK|nr:hypothetical protein [Paraburkholderia haematera]CAE6713572.1 hypothetical protein R69888_01264 [Paraburkholderia haematera]
MKADIFLIIHAKKSAVTDRIGQIMSSVCGTSEDDFARSVGAAADECAILGDSYRALAMYQRVNAECIARGAEMPLETHALLQDVLDEFAKLAGLPC